MISADTLVLLSDIDGFYSADPRENPSAEFIPEISAITPSIEAMVNETPLGDLPDVAAVTNAVLYLASDESAFVTGENIHIDGGGALRRLPRRDEIIRSVTEAMANQKP